MDDAPDDCHAISAPSGTGANAATADVDVDVDVVPSTRFDATGTSGAERFEVWRSSISVVFDSTPVARQDLEDFRATVHATHLGHLVAADADFGAQRYSRKRSKAARDGLDHYLVQWYRTGGFVGSAGGNEVEVAPGTVVFFDLTRTIETWARPSQALTLILPRSRVDAAIPNAERLHGTVLGQHNVFGNLLTDHLGSLMRRLPEVPLEHGQAVANATVQMVAACFQPGSSTMSGAQSEMRAVKLERVQRYIANNLGAPLDPHSLCLAFGLSRTVLYEFFEPMGGVTRYIMQRRLQRAFHLLANPANRRLRIADISARVGFASGAHFSRAFKTTFGMTPLDVRGASSVGKLPVDALATADLLYSAEYAAWVRGLHGS
ncbi:MAG: helix-turn-helix domain-containing protein [Pseudomonadota bacterium]